MNDSITKPRLSIITVNMNNAGGLRKTIESVVSQTFTDFEYIIIDGSSTDGSVEVIKEFADRITFWVSEPDMGIYNAMNKGILKSNGEYLQFLNSGDWLVDKNVLLNVFENFTLADISYGHLIKVNRDKSEAITYQAPSEKKLTFAHFYFDSLPHPSTFILRELFKDQLYDEEYTIAADKKFFVDKIIIQNCSIKQLDCVIACFNTDGISHSLKNQALIQEENSRIIAQLVPPRIASDYELLSAIKHSTLVKYIPQLAKTNRFQILVTGIVAILLKLYLLINFKKWKQ
ncbi:MAG: glycosyltransferase family 2 protein [Bacteroidales bacterium]|nr:glycosyltransferase family 2 protein [Bacteroidales bacterium]